MIHIQTKRYQITLWVTQDRHGSSPALQIDFDSEAQARAEFEKHKSGKLYRSGILLEFHRVSSEWNLLDKFS